MSVDAVTLGFPSSETKEAETFSSMKMPPAQKVWIMKTWFAKERVEEPEL